MVHEYSKGVGYAQPTDKRAAARKDAGGDGRRAQPISWYFIFLQVPKQEF